MSTDFIARGLSRQSTSLLASTVSGEGSAGIGFRAAGASTSGRTVQDKLREFVSVRDFGALGDGTTDDTAAIQAAITATVGTLGGKLHFPNGTYKITAKLAIPVSYGWVIEGASRVGVKIVQFTANKPIFSLEGDNTWGWVIKGFTFSWNVQQTSANTGAIAIKLGTGVAGNNFYQWEVCDCAFEKGFRGIAADPTTSPAVWGVHVHDCLFNSTMTGASFYAVPSPAIGQPNICIENCLLKADIAAEELIQVATGDVLTLRNLEFLNGATAFALMQITGTPAVSLVDCKSENYNAGTGGARLFKFSQCNVRVFNASVNGVLGTGASAESYFLFGNSGTTMTIFGLTANDAMTGGLLFAYTADTAVPFVSDVKITGPRCSDNVFPYTGCFPKFDADKRQKDNITDLGDAAVVLTAASGTVQYQNVTLTASRTITLPSSGLYQGMAFHIVRRATTPGAFTLVVSDPVSAVNYTFASATNGYVKYRSTGSAWRIVEAGTV